ncbi:unnamed protein product [Adineta steineri]|uniref:Uncharacterized protein n=1 Tax=Adineta steineri TaxID=433720 RepID=A0A815FCU2_9BILA|nr:unnamed protein product [Adineta steineri]CAF1317393.1 unnamed protein product [Adineta steineri]CAF3554561.1 unnamed protein product [Adineta steineri]CAF3586907.1 unnamed protein product [Adineta steineri]
MLTSTDQPFSYISYLRQLVDNIDIPHLPPPPTPYISTRFVSTTDIQQRALNKSPILKKKKKKKNKKNKIDDQVSLHIKLVTPRPIMLQSCFNEIIHRLTNGRILPDRNKINPRSCKKTLNNEPIVIDLTND